MEIERSRNGYYTITFFNKNNLDEEEIRREFCTVGNIRKIIQTHQRVFIRFQEKEEAQRAILKFGKIYDVQMAKNSNISNFSLDGGSAHNTFPRGSHGPISAAAQAECSTVNSGKGSPDNSVCHLILGNLPKNYTVKDISALVEEADPLCINQIDETRVFSVKFCHIVLPSHEKLSYLIDKLDGFVICGEKLIAAEARNLLEWREKTCESKFTFGKPVQKSPGNDIKNATPNRGRGRYWQ